MEGLADVAQVCRGGQHGSDRRKRQVAETILEVARLEVCFDVRHYILLFDAEGCVLDETERVEVEMADCRWVERVHMVRLSRLLEPVWVGRQDMYRQLSAWCGCRGRSSVCHWFDGMTFDCAPSATSSAPVMKVSRRMSGTERR